MSDAGSRESWAQGRGVARAQTHDCVSAEGLLELRVIRIQVQLDPIKPGRAPWRVYQPAVLHEVAELITSPDGVVGLDADGTEHLDVHNRTHPATRDRKGRAGISIMTTGDYAALRARYGGHLVDGIAGESILLDFSPGLAGRAMPQSVMVRHAGVTGGSLAPAVNGGSLASRADTQCRGLLLTGVHIAEPCVEFTRYCLKLPASNQVGDDVRQGLLDLGGGARGYKMVAARAGRIRVGDVLVIGQS